MTPAQRSLVQQLLEMGFTQQQAEDAVIAGKKTDLGSAVDFIYSRPANTALQSALSSLADAAASASANPPVAPTSEDAQMAEAIRASLETSIAPPPSSMLGEDREQQLAILASIQASAGQVGQMQDGVWVDPANPHQRMRAPSMPVGLKNTGNVCYFNSLIQVYFHLRLRVLAAILAIDVSEQAIARAEAAANSHTNTINVTTNSATAGVDSSADNPSQLTHIATATGPATASTSDAVPSLARRSLLFVLSLQQLFCAMHLSQRKYLDPSSTLGALFAASGHSSDEQKMQHDAAEWHDLIVDIINTAAEATYTASSSAEKPTVIPTATAAASTSASESFRTLFFSEFQQDLHAIDANNAAVLVSAPIYVSPMILDIAPGSLIDAIESYTVSSVPSYRLPSNHVCDAERRLLFTAFPRVLCFQLQRVGYDAKKGVAIKDNSRFLFDDRLWLDRWSASNQTEIETRRSAVRQWRQQLTSVNEERSKILNFEGEGLALHTALTVSAKFVAAQNGVNFSSSEISQSLLSLAETVRTRLGALDAECARLESQISGAFDSLRTANHEYALFAALIHDGREAGTGHYWSYIRQGATDRFHKFNDAIVSEVDYATVKKESEGGQTTTSASAYFLIYAHRHDIEHSDKLDLTALFAPAMRAAVNADNDKFGCELQAWDVESARKLIDSEVSRLLQSFQSDLRDHEQQVSAMKASKSSTNSRGELGLYSFPMWLATATSHNWLGAFVLLDDAINDCVHTDDDSRQKIRAALLDKTAAAGQELAANKHRHGLQAAEQAQLALYESLYKAYSECYSWSTQAMQDLCVAKQPLKALAAFLRAWISAHSHTDAALSGARNYLHTVRSLYLWAALMTAKYWIVTDADEAFTALKRRAYSWLRLVERVSSLTLSSTSVADQNLRAVFQSDIVLLSSQCDERLGGEERTAMETTVQAFVAVEMLDFHSENERLQTMHACIAQCEADDPSVPTTAPQWHGRTLLAAFHEGVDAVQRTFSQTMTVVNAALRTGDREPSDEEFIEVLPLANAAALQPHAALASTETTEGTASMDLMDSEAQPSTAPASNPTTSTNSSSQ